MNGAISQSICVPAGEHAEQGHGDDLQIEGETPVAEIVEVIFQLYAPGGKSRRLLEALAFTYAVVMAASFLYRQASYLRLVVGISAVALFALASLTRVLFRVFLEFLRKDGRNEVKILMVGTDHFARRVSTSLLHGEVLPCRVVGFVRLPDQEVDVNGPVYELDQLL